MTTTRRTAEATTAEATTAEATAEAAATEATTDRRGLGRLSQVSVRTRIVAVIAILMAVAMSGAGLLVYALESARIERDVTDQIDQEIAEFRELTVDPLTGQPFDDVARMLDVFLTRNVPDDNEMLVGYADDTRPTRTLHPDGQELLDEPAYRRAVDAPPGDVGTTVIDSERLGEVWVTVVPVSNSESRGSLVIVNFLEGEHDELQRTLGTYALVALMSLILITTIAGFQSGRLLAPLRTLEETARDITTTDLSRRIPERGNDDITALTRTINLMLARLEAGFAEQRRFLDDAGHELRTPLTVLRGHLELLDVSDRDEVVETRVLLLDEIDRMARLVGDLTVLAKSRRPDFLTPTPVDLGQLTTSLLAKARGLGDRDWRLDAKAEGIIVVDEQRLTQAVLQLADNAVKHTTPGDVIAIGSSFSESTARVWVRDTGPGVPEHQRTSIFERFGRGDAHPGDEGFGLGLSIVQAIVIAHGGTVSVSDAKPAGALFELVLPTQEVSSHGPHPDR